MNWFPTPNDQISKNTYEYVQGGRGIQHARSQKAESKTTPWPEAVHNERSLQGIHWRIWEYNWCERAAVDDEWIRVPVNVSEHSGDVDIFNILNQIC